MKANHPGRRPDRWNSAFRNHVADRSLAALKQLGHITDCEQSTYSVFKEWFRLYTVLSRCERAHSTTPHRSKKSFLQRLKLTALLLDFTNQSPSLCLGFGRDLYRFGVVAAYLPVVQVLVRQRCVLSLRRRASALCGFFQEVLDDSLQSLRQGRIQLPNDFPFDRGRLLFLRRLPVPYGGHTQN